MRHHVPHDAWRFYFSGVRVSVAIEGHGVVLRLGARGCRRCKIDDCCCWWGLSFP